MITRQDYMNGDSSSKYRAYYGQFVNEQVKARVLDHIAKADLLASKDEHLNDIPMKKWDALGGFAFRTTVSGEEIMVKRPTSTEPISHALLKETGEGVSPATLVCIYKEAARQIIEENKYAVDAVRLGNGTSGQQ